MQTSEARALKGAGNNFLQDLQALPEEVFDRKFGEKTRTVADIVYEVNLVNDHVCMVLRGEEPFEWPEDGWITAPENFRTKNQVVGGFEKSLASAQSTADGFSTEELLTTVATEHGDRSRAERIRFMTLHLWYHSGQLNFIQTLLGDDGWHWK